MDCKIITEGIDYKNSPNGEKQKVSIECRFYVYFENEGFITEIDIPFVIVITRSLHQEFANKPPEHFQGYDSPTVRNINGTYHLYENDGNGQPVGSCKAKVSGKASEIIRLITLAGLKTFESPFKSHLPAELESIGDTYKEHYSYEITTDN